MNHHIVYMIYSILWGCLGPNLKVNVLAIYQSDIPKSLNVFFQPCFEHKRKKSPVGPQIFKAKKTHTPGGLFTLILNSIRWSILDMVGMTLGIQRLGFLGDAFVWVLGYQRVNLWKKARLKWSVCKGVTRGTWSHVASLAQDMVLIQEEVYIVNIVHLESNNKWIVGRFAM